MLIQPDLVFWLIIPMVPDPFFASQTMLKKAVIWYVGKDFHGEKTMDDSAYRMLVTSATDASMNNIQINGRIKGHLFHGLVEWANGNILKGIRWMLKR